MWMTQANVAHSPSQVHARTLFSFLFSPHPQLENMNDTWEDTPQDQSTVSVMKSTSDSLSLDQGSHLWCVSHFLFVFLSVDERTCTGGHTPHIQAHKSPESPHMHALA